MILISRELKSLLDAPDISTTVNAYGHDYNTGTYGRVGQINNSIGKPLIGSKEFFKLYLKRRAFSLILLAAVLILLVTTSLFTDLGLNIGQAILNFLGF